MQIKVFQFQALPQPYLTAWSAVQRANPALSSPFFSPEFSSAVAAVRENTRVAVLSNGQEILGFFPYELGRFATARPLAMCDYQGIIAHQDVPLEPKALLRGCRLNAWYYDHLLVAQQPFSPFHRTVTESPGMDLSAGYDPYVASLGDDGKDHIRKAGTSRRRLERELGALRFISDDRDMAVLEKLLQWKSARYGAVPDWARRVLLQLFATRTDGLNGMLSSLYAGERLVAAHFGLRRNHVLHEWFPAFDPELARFGPGVVLRLCIAREVPGMGIQYIDFGKGGQDYKRRLKNAAIPIAEGGIENLSVYTALKGIQRKTLEQVRNTPLFLGAARRVSQTVRQVLAHFQRSAL